MEQQRFVIVGAGLAGGTAAMTLRDEGFQGEVSLVGQEPHPPYERPPLSKGYLRGEEQFENQLVNPRDSYAESDIELRLGIRAERIDPDRRTVLLQGGESLSYDRLLFTTGGRNRTLDVPGAGLEGILQLRTVEESDRIRREATGAQRAVVVGMGFIGSEVTASLRQLGAQVTTIEGHRWPLSRVLGEEVGQVLAEVHRDHEVELVLEDSVAAFEGSGRVEQVRTKAGRVIDCDYVVVGIGITPDTELLEHAGATIENGVLVDELCRTNLPDVYAAGDIANHQHPVFGRIRVEHFNNGSNQGRAAALSMMGRGAPYDYVHSFWSDQYDQSLEYVGMAQDWDRLVIRGSLERRSFLAFYLKDGILQAAFGLNRGGDPEDPEQDGELKACVPLIRHRLRIDPALLAREDHDLSSLEIR